MSLDRTHCWSRWSARWNHCALWQWCSTGSEWLQIEADRGAIEVRRFFAWVAEGTDADARSIPVKEVGAVGATIVVFDNVVAAFVRECSLSHRA